MLDEPAKPMTILIFGKPDLLQDSVPLKILPRLSKQFPKIEFKVIDPNEDWSIPEDITVIDTVINIKEPKIFSDIESFSLPPRLTMHDFDALTNMKYLKKIGKIKKIKIIGIPPEMPEDTVLEFLTATLRSSQP